MNIIICRWDVKYVTIHNVQFNGSIFLALESQKSLQDTGIAMSANWRLARSRSSVETEEGETGKLNVFFKPTLWNSVFVQILKYIFKLHSLTLNPLLLACRIF